MTQATYKGTVQDVQPVQSSKKGTDGIEMIVDLRSKDYGLEGFKPIERITRRLRLWFPKGRSHEYSLKKLRAAGWRGGGLESLSELVGREIEVVSKIETFEGRDQEKFDLPLPRRDGGTGSPTSEAAGLAIDAILQSAPIDPEAADAAPSSRPSASPAPAVNPDDVPF